MCVNTVQRVCETADLVIVEPVRAELRKRTIKADVPDDRLKHRELLCRLLAQDLVQPIELRLQSALCP